MNATTTDKIWKIEGIEKITEQEAREMAQEALNIKGHTIYLVDFGGYFGYSALVFADGRHIYHANDYELHHKPSQWDEREPYTHDELREIYIKELNGALFTEQEIEEPLKNYDEYSRKENYLRNYYGMRRDYLSMFHIFHDKKEEQEYREKQEKCYPVVNPINFAYYAEENRDFVNHNVKLFGILQKRKVDVKDNFEYWREAFVYELGNHEYHINPYQGDWDTLSAFGNIKWHGQGAEARKEYYKELKFTKTQIEAFEQARLDFFKKCRENDWY